MSLLITSTQNPRVKDAIHLRDRRQRTRRGQILIDGAREVAQAIAGGLELQEVFVCRELCNSDRAHYALEQVESRITPTWVAENVFEKIAYGDRQDGIVAVASTPSSKLSDLLPFTDACVVALERIEKPGNIGAVMRSADGAGVAAVIHADGGTDLYNPNTIRASLGTIFRLPVCESTGAQAREWLRARGTRIYVARVNGSIPYTDVDYAGPIALVLGSEAQGLSSVWSGVDVTAISIPMLGSADSLNVSAAAAILFYEAQRQRKTRA